MRPYEDIPGNLKLWVYHLHQGNSSRNQRHGKPYVTYAHLMEPETGKIIVTGCAKCSREDVPNRRRGREIAVGRVLAAYEKSLRQVQGVQAERTFLSNSNRQKLRGIETA